MVILTLWLVLQELFPGSKYKMKNEGDTYQLIIFNPKLEDTGKYTIEIGGVVSTAFLNVDGKTHICNNNNLYIKKKSLR